MLQKCSMPFWYLSLLLIGFFIYDRLTHFVPYVSFHTPRKHQKTFDFLMFSGDIKREMVLSMFVVANLSLKLAFVFFEGRSSLFVL